MLRGYTIPVLDLSRDTFRQIVVDREKDQYLGHVTTVLLDDGRTIVAVYPKTHGFGPIVLKKSYDGGLTWTDRLPVPASWETSLEVPTIFKTVGADGAKHIILFSGRYPIRMAHSEDDGNTWSELTPIGDYGGIVAMGDVVSCGAGEYLAFFHDHDCYLHPSGENRTEIYTTGAGRDVQARFVHSSSDGRGGWIPYAVTNTNHAMYETPGQALTLRLVTKSGIERKAPFVVYRVRSTDGGLTWSEPAAVVTHPEAHLCEPGLVRSPDGRQLAMLLRENSRQFNSFVSFSDDNGETWSEPCEVPGALTGDRHTIRYLKDGRLFVSFRDTGLESPTYGDWVGWVGTYEDIAEGREGQYRVRLMENHNGADCAYPGVVVLPDGMVAATTYGHWAKGEPPYIVTVRFQPPAALAPAALAPAALA